MKPQHSRQRHDPSKSLVGFLVGEVHYALPISGVREIANPVGVAPLPHAPPAVAGVADYRNEVLPVVELRARFGLPIALPTRRTKWIVADVSGHWIALVVDAVTGVFGTGGLDLRPPPALARDDRRGILGVTNVGEGLVFVLDRSCLKDLTDILQGDEGVHGHPGMPGLLPGSS